MNLSVNIGLKALQKAVFMIFTEERYLENGKYVVIANAGEYLVWSLHKRNSPELDHSLYDYKMPRWESDGFADPAALHNYFREQWRRFIQKLHNNGLVLVQKTGAQSVIGEVKGPEPMLSNWDGLYRPPFTYDDREDFECIWDANNHTVLTLFGTGGPGFIKKKNAFGRYVRDVLNRDSEKIILGEVFYNINQIPDMEEETISKTVLIDLDGRKKNFTLGSYHTDSKQWITQSGDEPDSKHGKWKYVIPE